MKTTQTTPHAVDHIHYHLNWAPRYRKKVWVGPIGESLKTLLCENANQNAFKMVVQEIMPDPVLLFASAPPKDFSAKIVHLFNGPTYGKLKKGLAILRHPSGGKQAKLWAERY